MPAYSVRLPAADGRPRHTVGIGLRTDDLFVPEVPAGRYELFFISESPTTVHIRLDGLSGHTAIAMTDAIADHVDGEVMQPNVEQDLRTPDGPAEIGADAYGLGWLGESRGNRTLVFDAFWYRGPTAPIPGGVSDQPLLNIGQTERCAYGDTLPLPPEASASMFTPGCPGGTTGSDTTILRAVQTAAVVLFGIEEGAPGHEIGRGGYAAHTGIYDPGMTGFWIDLAS